MECERDLSSKQNSRYFRFNQIYMGFEFDGIFYINGIYKTNKNSPQNDPKCGVGLYSYDPRCRSWYREASVQESANLQKPFIALYQEDPFLTQPSCQKMLKFNETTQRNDIHHVLCFDTWLSTLQNYFQNFAKSTKQTYVIDPLSQIILFDSQNRISKLHIETFSSLELSYLKNKQEAQLINNTIIEKFKQTSFYLNQMSYDKIRELQSQQFLSEYQRNNSKNFILLNPVYIFDKLSKPNGIYKQSANQFNFNHPLIDQQNPANYQDNQNNRRNNYQSSEFLQQNEQSGWKVILAYLQVNIISDEEMRQQSQKVNYYFKKLFFGIGLFLLILGIISVLVSIYYSIQIRRIILIPIIQLTNVLNKMLQEKDLSQVILLLEDYDLDIEEIFYSKETKRLYESLEEIFKIIKFSKENFYKENITITLLNLNDYLNFFKQFQNHYAVGIAHNNIGCILLNQNHFTQALEHFSQAIIFSKYEIQQFCSQYPLISYSSQFLHDYCFKNTSTFEIQRIKKLSSKISTTQSKISQSEDSRSFPNKSRNQSPVRQKRQLQNIVQSNQHQEQLKINVQQDYQYQQKLNKYIFMRKQEDIFLYNQNEYYQQRIRLIFSLYYRKKNFVIALIQLQEHLDNSIKKKLVQDYHNFWKEIKILLKELLFLANQLPIWQSQQIEILLNISKCQFKLNNISKYKLLIEQCEILIEKLGKNENINICNQSPIQEKSSSKNNQNPQSFFSWEEFQPKQQNSLLNHKSNILLQSQKPLENKSVFKNKMVDSIQQLRQSQSQIVKSLIGNQKSSSKEEEQMRRITANTNLEISKISKQRRENKVMTIDEKYNQYISNFQFNFMFTREALGLIKELIQSEYKIHIKCYKDAITQLTNMLENSKFLLSHLPNIIIKYLSDLLIQQNITSNEIQQYTNQFSHNLIYQVVIIFAEQESQSTNQNLDAFTNKISQNNFIDQTIFQDKPNDNKEKLQSIQAKVLINMIQDVLIKQKDIIGVIKIIKDEQDEEKLLFATILEQLQVQQVRPLLFYLIEQLTDYNINLDLIKILELNENGNINESKSSISQDEFPICNEYDKSNQVIKSQNNISQFNKNNNNSPYIDFLQSSFINMSSPFLLNKSNSKIDDLIINRQITKTLFQLPDQGNKFEQLNPTSPCNAFNTSDIILQKRNVSIKRLSSNEASKNFDLYNNSTCLKQRNSINKSPKLLHSSITFTNLNNFDMILSKEESKEYINDLSFERLSLSNQLIPSKKANRCTRNQKQNIDQNYVFHNSIRKALNQLITVSDLKYHFKKEKYYQSKKEDRYTQQQESNELDSNNQLQKFVIYQIDEISITNNQLLEKLCSFLRQFNIKLIILSKKRGDNFLEKNKIEPITVLYSIDKLNQYLISFRNTFSQYTYPSYLQHF